MLLLITNAHVFDFNQAKLRQKEEAARMHVKPRELSVDNWSPGKSKNAKNLVKYTYFASIDSR